MARRLVIRPEAEDDLAEAFDWYEDREPGLGFELLDEVGRRLESVRQSPEQFELVYRRYRRALVKRFPYAIFFREEEDRIEVFAVMHTARRTGHWRRRLP